jgi:hypothetical protein
MAEEPEENGKQNGSEERQGEVGNLWHEAATTGTMSETAEIS